jgi:hypothetical protein
MRFRYAQTSTQFVQPGQSTLFALAPPPAGILTGGAPRALASRGAHPAHSIFPLPVI